MAKREPKGCPHVNDPMVVRIGCHTDLLSKACMDAAQLSMWCCPLPSCQRRRAAEVKTFTGFEAVFVPKSTAGAR